MSLGQATTENIVIGDIDNDLDLDFAISESTLFRVYHNSVSGS